MLSSFFGAVWFCLVPYSELLCFVLRTLLNNTLIYFCDGFYRKVHFVVAPMALWCDVFFLMFFLLFCPTSYVLFSFFLLFIFSRLIDWCKAKVCCWSRHIWPENNESFEMIESFVTFLVNSNEFVFLLLTEANVNIPSRMLISIIIYWFSFYWTKFQEIPMYCASLKVEKEIFLLEKNHAWLM